MDSVSSFHFELTAFSGFVTVLEGFILFLQSLWAWLLKPLLMLSESKLLEASSNTT